MVEEKLKARVSKSLKVKKKVEMENIPMSLGVKIFKEWEMWRRD